MDDLEALQGTWEQVSFAVDGERFSYDATGVLTVFNATKFVVQSREGEILLSGSFRLDPSTSPKSVDWIDDVGPDAGKVLPAIYRLEDDHLIFVAAGEGKPRPGTFEPGAGLSMRGFIRRTSSN